MYHSVRTIVELPDRQLEALARLCRKEGISRAEAIRRAVDRLVCNDGVAQMQEDRQAGFGLWRSRKFDASERVRALRAEWEDRSDGEPRP